MNVEGYGRYGDDPAVVGCPRARSDMTPCAARDGALAVHGPRDEPDGGSAGHCVGCYEVAADLLRDLVRAVTAVPRSPGGATPSA